jgi:predicted Zn-dependent protease
MQDPEVNDYLNELGHRLVNACHDAKQDFEFFAVPDTTINAFALAGRLHRRQHGLIVLAQNESELASVLAHEISHVTQRHMARMIDNQKNSMLMTLAGLALACSRRGGRRQRASDGSAHPGHAGAAIQNQLNFTRENEYEADRVGFQRLVAAGSTRTALGGLMERLQRSHPLRRRQRAVVPAHAPDHVRAHRRGAVARAEHAVPQVADSLDFHLVRALLKSYQGDARETVASFDDALRRAQVQQRDRRALRPRRRAAARQEHRRARRPSSRSSSASRRRIR